MISPVQVQVLSPTLKTACHPAKRTAYLTTLTNYTAGLLSRADLWEAVMAPADVLLDSKELSGDEAECVIREALSEHQLPC